MNRFQVVRVNRVRVTATNRATFVDVDSDAGAAMELPTMSNEKRIVLLLGAGASYSYGFPLNGELYDALLKRRRREEWFKRLTINEGHRKALPACFWNRLELSVGASGIPQSRFDSYLRTLDDAGHVSVDEIYGG
jgi:hypothetical protein